MTTLRFSALHPVDELMAYLKKKNNWRGTAKIEAVRNAKDREVKKGNKEGNEKTSLKHYWAKK